MAITINGTDGLTSDNGALKLDGTTLVVDDTNNRVGIGTASPATTLAVSGGIAGTAGLNVSGGGWGVLPYVPNSLVIDNNSGQSRFFATGADASTDGSFIFYTGQTDGGANERLRILSSGGITFNGDTAAANALDDYEEGTFTPTAYGQSSAGSTSYTLQGGSYTKIGRCVTVSVRLEYSAMTGTGNLSIGGFPFTSTNDSMEYMGVMMVKTLNWGGGTMMSCYLPANSSVAYLYYSSDDADWSNQQCVNEGAGFRITLTYFTA